MSEQIDYELLRERVEKGVKRQKSASRIVFLVMNVVFFLIFMGMAWWSAIATPEMGELSGQVKEAVEMMIIMPTIGWGTALLFHFLSVMIDFGMGDRDMRARVTAREISDQLLDDKLHQAASKMSEKPKRRESDADLADEGGNMVLSDDGELQYIDDSIEEVSKRRSAK